MDMHIGKSIRHDTNKTTYPFKKNLGHEKGKYMFIKV